MSTQPKGPKKTASPPSGKQGGPPSVSEFQELLNHLPDPAFIYDKTTLGILAVNEAAVQRYGWTRNELLTMSILDIRPESERESFLALIKEFPPKRQTKSFGHHVTKDGRAFLVDVDAADIQFQGEACRIVLARDGFESRMAWQALKETQETYTSLVENLSEGIAILDEDGRFIFMNVACPLIFGLASEAMLGRKLPELVGPEDRERLAQIFRKQSGPIHDALEMEITREDGVKRWVAFRAASRLDSSGRKAGAFASFFDITQHRMALEALQSSEAKFRRLVEMLPQGLVTYQDGKIIYSNPAAAAITRTDPENTLGKPILDFIHPDFWPLIKERLGRMLKGADVPPMDYLFRRSDGSTVEVEASAMVLEEGDHPVLISVFTDLTKRLEMEQAIRENEERWRMLGQQTGQLIYDYNLSADKAVWAGPYSALLGEESPSILSSSDWESRIHPEDLASALNELNRCRETLTPYRAEYRFQRADDTYFPVEDHGVFIKDRKGVATRMIGTMRDISERYQSAQALRESEELYRSVIEQARDLIFLVDLETGAIVQTNDAFHQALGYPREALPGLTLYDIVDAPRDSVELNIKRIQENGSITIGQRRYRNADGSFRDVEVSGSICHTAGKDLLVVLALDITDRLATERALQQAQKLESLGILAGGIAHDFNNLLTAMMGNLSLAQMKSHPSSPSMPYLDALEKSLQRAADLTRQMLAYSGKGRFVAKILELNPMVEEMANLLAVSISKRISLRFNLGNKLPPIEADPSQLQQVVMNLVTNASDAIGDKDGVIRITTDLVELDQETVAKAFPVQHLEPGPFLVLEVTDTGIGMDPETQQRIFEPFFTTKAKGRGLGLSAMLGILRGHKAGIQIESTLGQGTTFRIYFPAKSGGRVEEVDGPTAHRFHPRGAVLVVDDEDDIRSSAIELLQTLGFDSVLEARDGVEAVEVFKENHSGIALVFMDLTMPRMNGKDAFHAMKEINPSIPVVLTSGFSEAPDLKGADRPEAFLEKPYRFQDLGDMVLRVLGKSFKDQN